jgi:hypothetical protein
MNIADYYLDLDKVSTLNTEDERQYIHNYYRDMMYAVAEKRYDQAQSIMTTLIRAGYLKNATQEERQEKIETILG